MVDMGYQFRIYPNQAQRQLIERTFGCTRWVWNHFLNKRQVEYEETGRTLRRPRRGTAGGMGRRARSARRPQVEGRTQGDSLMHRGFCTDCGAYAALGENDRCAACDAWRHREEERQDHV